MASSKQLAGLVGPRIVAMIGMFAAGAYQQWAASTPTPVFTVVEGILLLCGIVLTFKAYTRGEVGGR